MLGYNCRVASRPTLVVVSGPIGAGKTTLAHRLAQAVGCPAICRDEIKEGMAQSRPGFVPAPGDELTMRTLPVFFGVRAFTRVAVAAPGIEVDTTDGYQPGLDDIVRFVT